MTKEERKEYNKQWYQNNIERKKQYYLNNKECRNKYDELYCKSLILSYHIVYLLPNHNYVGITNNPYKRMVRHKSKHNRNISNWIELKRFDTREEALVYESQLHSQGYAGGK